MHAQVAASSTQSTNNAARESVASSAPPTTGVKTSSTTSTRAVSQPAEMTLTEEPIIVTGDELPSAYGAPGAFSRSRFSPITNGYVLAPGEVFAGLIYQGDFDSRDPADNRFTQEIEVGIPYRFGAAIENEVDNFDGDTVNGSFSIEGRWALADWGKIPLNPTLFAEYKFGTGRILHEEGPPKEMMNDGEVDPEEEEMMMREEEARARANRPDAYEFRLLLSEEITKDVQWAFNAFLENETSGDRGREWGFAQSIQVPLFLPRERFKVGLEMQYKNFTVKDTRGDPISSFVIGPSFAYKPTARMRFDVAPLFGVTKDSPDVQFFAVFSYAFGGGGGEREAEAPASTRNR
ncbi:MAG: hypothetical protein ABI540_02005 [Spartobacteria bacterium]